MFANARLRTKFTLVLAAVLLIGVILAGFVAWQIMTTTVEADFTSRGLLLLELMDGVRNYTNGHVTPLLAGQQTSQQFLSEAVPNFSARTVFETVQKAGHGSEFTYKEAAPNPRRPEDQTDDFETALVQRMASDRNVAQISGYRTMNGQTYFYIARPMVVQSQACLNCHGEASKAPIALVSKYGAERGFGWQLNQVIAAQMAYVPAGDVLNEALKRLLLLVVLFGGILVLALLLINIAIGRYVLRPVGVLGGLANKVAEDGLKPADLETGEVFGVIKLRDELGELGRAFALMANEVYARTQSLRQTVAQLNIQIDEIKRKKEVQAVVDSDTFKDIQAQARRLRERRAQQEQLAKKS